jgi:hypothetical protein
MHYRAGNLVPGTLPVPFGFGFQIELVTTACLSAGVPRFAFAWAQLLKVS